MIENNPIRKKKKKDIISDRKFQDVVTGIRWSLHTEPSTQEDTQRLFTYQFLIKYSEKKEYMEHLKVGGSYVFSFILAGIVFLITSNILESSAYLYKDTAAAVVAGLMLIGGYGISHEERSGIKQRHDYITKIKKAFDLDSYSNADFRRAVRLTMMSERGEDKTSKVDEETQQLIELKRQLIVPDREDRFDMDELSRLLDLGEANVQGGEYTDEDILPKRKKGE